MGWLLQLLVDEDGRTAPRSAAMDTYCCASGRSWRRYENRTNNNNSKIIFFERVVGRGAKISESGKVASPESMAVNL